MNGPRPVTLVLLCVVTTALTYLVMHVVVAPRLAASAVEVPVLVGMMPEQARALTDARGLLLVLDGEKPLAEDVRLPPGALCEQAPLGGSRLHVGEKVHGFVGRVQPVEHVQVGPVVQVEQVAVPDLRGKSPSVAGKLLEQAGLVLGSKRTGVDDNAADGVVLRQSPAAGAQVSRGDKVDIVVNE